MKLSCHLASLFPACLPSHQTFEIGIVVGGSFVCTSLIPSVNTVLLCAETSILVSRDEETDRGREDRSEGGRRPCSQTPKPTSPQPMDPFLLNRFSKLLWGRYKSDMRVLGIRALGPAGRYRHDRRQHREQLGELWDWTLPRSQVVIATEFSCSYSLLLWVCFNSSLFFLTQ
ncbi:hypothetical protein F5Y11DRAFT_317925 [Daldinia sp. FL1419]|nr:hypothetical protein F5Y11DRAFT_317925 [Daldinia sp. FL1419]